MTTALAINCTLKPSPAESSSELIARHILDALAEQGVTGDIVRAVDFDIRPGVERDMGDGDEWPALFERVAAADILVIATPTWLGHMSSVTQRVLERLDAEISETDDAGCPGMLGKVAMCGVVGNEDGAHKIIADVFGALNDIATAPQLLRSLSLDAVPEVVALFATGDRERLLGEARTAFRALRDAAPFWR